MPSHIQRVAEFVRHADTEELLDRVTVYREDMEGFAVELMEAELDRRGITPEEISEFHRLRLATALRDREGHVIRCLLCDRPATGRGWGWLTMFAGTVPVIPWKFAYCDLHIQRS